MKTTPLKTSDPNVMLIEPDIERDARLGVLWLAGDTGRNTLQLMGVSNKNNKPTTLEYERLRVAEFIDGKDQLNWMIEHGGKVIGAVWVDLKSTDAIPGPAIHIMIGDDTARGKGVGLSAVEAVAKYLNDNGNKTIYSRHLVKNAGAKKLLKNLKFENLGEPYVDNDGLEWQNVILNF